MNPILSASGLNTFYGRSHILFDRGLEVRKGETVCLVGRNGAGKTTTFRTLMNLPPPRPGPRRTMRPRRAGSTPRNRRPSKTAAATSSW